MNKEEKKYYLRQLKGKKFSEVTYEDFKENIVRTPEYIPWDVIEVKLGKRRYKQFLEFMNGQTCMELGAYPCDVENFFNQSNRFFD